MVSETPNEQGPSADDQASQGDGGQEKPPSSETAKSRIEAPEEKHRFAERNNWRVQNGLTAFGVIFAFIAAAGGALSAYEASKAVVASQEGATQARRAADEAHNEVVEAKRQADYAGEQLNLAETAALEAIVPHVSGSFEDVPISNIQLGKQLTVRFDLRNGGPGLAYNVTGKGVASVLPASLSDDTQLPPVSGAEDHPLGPTMLPSVTSERAFII